MGGTLLQKSEMVVQMLPRGVSTTGMQGRGTLSLHSACARTLQSGQWNILFPNVVLKINIMFAYLNQIKYELLKKLVSTYSVGNHDK